MQILIVTLALLAALVAAARLRRLLLAVLRAIAVTATVAGALALFVATR